MRAKNSGDLYGILGISKNASLADIKAAYRSKAMELHPDRNQSRDTTAEFQALQGAYETLSDETLRQQYDADSAVPSGSRSEHGGDYKPLAPIVCSKCNAVSAQPHFKVFYTVFSYIFGAYKKPYQGIFCSSCELKTGLKASAITLATGWWSIAGFFWTIQTLFQNLVGGRFNEQNARLQALQAAYFAQSGKLELARAIAAAALKLAERAKTSRADDGISIQALRKHLADFIHSLPASTRTVELKNTSDIFNSRFVAQFALLFVFAGLVSGGIYQQEVASREQERIRLERQGLERARAAAIAAREAEELKKAELPLPPNGIMKLANRSSFNPNNAPPFKISNAPGANTLMKLVRTSDGMEVISIFIRAGQTVEVRVPPGSYKAKIASGQTWYGDAIRFGPSTSYAVLDTVLSFSVEGSQLLGNEVRLTRVREGNLRETPLSAKDF